MTDTNGNSLVNFDNMNQLLDSVRLHQYILVLGCLLEDCLPGRMRVAEQLLYVKLLTHLLCRDHVSNTLVDHELLMVL